MQLIVDFIAALVTSLAVALFAQLGIDLHTGDKPAQPEVRRTVERDPSAAGAAFRADHDDEC